MESMIFSYSTFGGLTYVRGILMVAIGGRADS